MRLRDFAFFAAVPFVAFAFLSAPAGAAPQILGLVASAEPVPMTCAGGLCTAELSSVCLQQSRPTPSTGTAYVPAEGTQITLTVTAKDGASRARRVETALSFRSVRQYTAVEVSVPETLVRQLGDGEVSLAVAPLASIVPVAVKGDPDPLGADEIASFTGPMRAAAEHVFASDADRVNATRVLNGMINRLPDGGAEGIGEMAALRRQTMGADVTAGTRGLIDRAASNCRELLRVGMVTTLRQCLGHQHDYLSGETTNEVWNALKPGS